MRFTFLLLAAAAAWAQLPDGPGKVETERICTQCHDLARSISLRQDRAGWQATMDKMVTLGAQGEDQELKAVVDYLAAHYPETMFPRSASTPHAQSTSRADSA